MTSLPDMLLIGDFIGRFHPALVHLPIGVLLLGCVFHLFSTRPKHLRLAVAVPPIFFWGAVTAMLASVTGYFLSGSGEYDEALTLQHQWLGISTAIVSVAAYQLVKRKPRAVFTRVISVLLILLIGITGHLGGSLTHGAGYLTTGVGQNSSGPAIPPIANISEAPVYASAVQPLLEARCYGCHGPNKKKGGLRLDKPELIMKGGEDGKAVVAGKVDESMMMERLLLPIDDEDHMPPKERTQLTGNEIELLHWWIASGADFNKKFGELPQSDRMKPVLAALQSGESSASEVETDYPTTTVGAPNPAIVERLKNNGIVVIPVVQGSNYLSVNFVSAFSTSDSVLQLLTGLQKNIVFLNAAGSNITDRDMEVVARLTQLSRLNLASTGITDSGLARLASLSQLRYLNLVGTKVTAGGLQKLAPLKALKSIYLYKTTVHSTDWPALQKTFPGVALDSGGYTVPTLPTDTTEVKYSE